MSEVEARQIIGISNNAGFAEAEQAYDNLLHKLRLKILPGNNAAKRVEAERKISQLMTAWEVLQKTYSAGGYPQPAAQYTQTPTAMPPAVFGSSSIPGQVQIAGIAIAALFMFIILITCMNSCRSYKQSRMAQLRILSVPWCYVEIDGKSVGQSGQVDAFKIIEGTHRLTFKSNGRVQTESIKIKRGQSFIAKVNFARSTVYVSSE